MTTQPSRANKRESIEDLEKGKVSKRIKVTNETTEVEENHTGDGDSSYFEYMRKFIISLIRALICLAIVAILIYFIALIPQVGLAVTITCGTIPLAIHLSYLPGMYEFSKDHSEQKKYFHAIGYAIINDCMNPISPVIFGISILLMFILLNNAIILPTFFGIVMFNISLLICHVAISELIPYLPNNFLKILPEHVYRDLATSSKEICRNNDHYREIDKINRTIADLHYSSDDDGYSSEEYDTDDDQQYGL